MCEAFRILIVARFMQIEANQQHLCQATAKASILGIARKREVFASKEQVVFDEFHHLCARKSGQRLFGQGVFQYFQWRNDQRTIHIIKHIREESTCTAHLSFILLFCGFIEIAVCNVVKHKRTAANLLRISPRILLVSCVIEPRNACSLREIV